MCFVWGGAVGLEGFSYVFLGNAENVVAMGFLVYLSFKKTLGQSSYIDFCLLFIDLTHFDQDVA